MSFPVSVRADQPHSPREQLESLLAEVNALALRLRRAAAPGTAGGLSPAARAVLRLLEQGRASVPTLARARGTSRQNIQSTVNHLKRAGLVGTAKNPAHKRSGLIYITENGRGVLDQGDAPGAAVLDLLLGSASGDELALASEVIRRLGQALDQILLTRRAGKARAAAKPPPQKPTVYPQSFDTDLPVSLL